MGFSVIRAILDHVYLMAQNSERRERFLIFCTRYENFGTVRNAFNYALQSGGDIDSFGLSVPYILCSQTYFGYLAIIYAHRHTASRWNDA
jgi:hypothetical protein